MKRRDPRSGATNSLYTMVLASIVVLAALSLLLFVLSSPNRPTGGTVGQDKAAESTKQGSAKVDPDTKGAKQELFMYCAAGMQYPLEEIAAQYQKEYGVAVQLQYGGSNTLLNQLEVSRTGDLYLAADDSFTRLAQKKGLVEERIPLARMRPVIAVQSKNPKKIGSVDDLLGDDVKVALGDPYGAAIGKTTKKLLSASGKWPELEKRVTVFKPTVNDVANATKLGSVDAGIIWDSTAAQYHDLRAVHVPELDVGIANIEVAVVSNSKSPTAALRFARYLAASDKGLQVFAAKGFEPIDGDKWAENPQLTFFAGSVNRRALDPIIREFEQREGVTVNTVYNGCGILTAQMRTLGKGRGAGFPDTYMACDVYYLNTVKEWFEDGVNVSDTDIVLVVQKGNPKGIRKIEDLVRPGIRVALGQPEQCTIGVLTRRLLQSEGIYQRLLGSGNVVTETQTSALLVPNITTGAADAVLAYRTDTNAEQNRLHVIDIDSPLAKAIQPFSIAKRSEFKYLGRRLFDRIAQSRDSFESAGFNWRLSPGRRRGVQNKNVAGNTVTDDSR